MTTSSVVSAVETYFADQSFWYVKMSVGKTGEDNGGSWYRDTC